jgi:mono/diheme cytochrome c family protein
MKRCPVSMARLAIVAVTLWGVAVGDQAWAADQLQARPDAPASAAAHDVLARHCADCHQSGDAGVPAPALGNILDLERLARQPHLVAPGNPEGSPLYVQMLQRIMPPHSPTGSVGPKGPSREDIAAVRAWIEQLPDRPACTASPTAGSDVGDRIAAYAAKSGDKARTLRFLSVAHLADSCLPQPDLDVVRRAVPGVVNSLSWKSDPVAVTAIDPSSTVFAFQLDAIGWQEEHWDKIVAAAGGGGGVGEALGETFGTATPAVRADWFAARVLAAPAYYEVLGLPLTIGDLERLLKVSNDSRMTAESRSSRDGDPKVTVSRAEALHGPIWVTRSETAAPVQALDGSSSTAGSLVTFTLPNGLHGVFAASADGMRMDRQPNAPSKAISVSGVRFGPEAWCPNCRAAGGAIALTGTAGEGLAAALAKDEAARRKAWGRVTGSSEGPIPETAGLALLAALHERPVDGERAAAELRIGVGQLLEIAAGAEGAQRSAALRLVTGLVPRQAFEEMRPTLQGALGGPDGPAARSEPPSRIENRPPILALHPDKVRYKVGDRLVLTVATDRDCHLTVVSVDGKGRGTVIFPNDFETNGLLKAGTELVFPKPKDGYFFRFNAAGRERIVALCNSGGSVTDGIRHDFERQRFMELGDYAAFVGQNVVLDPPVAAEQAKAPEPRREVRRRGRRAAPPSPPPPPLVQPHQIARTGVLIVID